MQSRGDPRISRPRNSERPPRGWGGVRALGPGTLPTLRGPSLPAAAGCVRTGTPLSGPERSEPLRLRAGAPAPAAPSPQAGVTAQACAVAPRPIPRGNSAFPGLPRATRTRAHGPIGARGGAGRRAGGPGWGPRAAPARSAGRWVPEPPGRPRGAAPGPCGGGGAPFKGPVLQPLPARGRPVPLSAH